MNTNGLCPLSSGVTGARNALNIAWEKVLYEQSVVSVLAVTNKMASKQARGEDSTATPKIS